MNMLFGSSVALAAAYWFLNEQNKVNIAEFKDHTNPYDPKLTKVSVTKDYFTKDKTKDYFTKDK